MSKLSTKLNNFSRALRRLEEAILAWQHNSVNDIIRDGVIQRFEFTYELSWKTAKEYLEDIGIVDKNSPKAVIKESYGQMLIANEENWLLMLKDRNLTSHVYSEEMAMEIVNRIADCYIKEFNFLLTKISN